MQVYQRYDGHYQEGDYIRDSKDERTKQFFGLCGIVATAMVWTAVWYLVEVMFRHLGVRSQIIGHAIILAIGLATLSLVAKSGIKL